MPALAWSSFLASLKGYRPAWLRRDVIAGLTIMALLIPEGMAYAKLAGVPPQTAFYAAPIGLVLYALLGSSRQLVVAVSAAVAVLSAATVAPLAPAGSAKFFALTAALAAMAGVVSVAAGLLRLGRVNQFFSSSVLTGFVFGLALVIAVKQVPKLFGIADVGGNFFERVVGIATHLGGVHGLTLAIGAASVVVLLAFERWWPRIPGPLVVLVAGLLVVLALGLERRGVAVVGHVPGGLVAPRLPDVGLADLAHLIGGAFGIALVAFAEAIGPARMIAARHGDAIDADRELVGLGAANLGAGLFQGFPIGSSLSKSAANDAAGARTELSAIVAAGFTLLVALFLTPAFRALPEATLAAIVVVAVSRMMHVDELVRLFRLRRADFLAAAVALIGVLALDILPGLLVAVGLSLFLTVYRATRPRLSVLGRSRATLAFVDRARDPAAVSIPGLLVVRPDEALFFGNATSLHDEIVHLVETSPDTRTVAIDLGYTTDLDVPGADMLISLADDLTHRGVALALAGATADLRRVLARTGVLARVGTRNVHRHLLDVAEEFLARDAVHAPEELDLLSDGVDRLRHLIDALLAHAPSGERNQLLSLRATLADAARLLHPHRRPT